MSKKSEKVKRKPESIRTVVTFGQANCPLSVDLVKGAIAEAATLLPKPKLLIFAVYEYDPLALHLIHEICCYEGITLLAATINMDLQIEDLKKKRSTNESFWLIGQPDVRLLAAGANEKGEGLYQVEVMGFDYFDPASGNMVSGGASRIAVWMLDTDYDGRSIFPHQVFFPMAGEKEGWAKLAKNLRAQIDEDLMEAYRGTVSLPFTAGHHKRAAVKIVDDRGSESIRLVAL